MVTKFELELEENTAENDEQQEGRALIFVVHRD